MSAGFERARRGIRDRLAASAARRSASTPAPQQPAGPTPGESPYRAAARLPVRITSFVVEPTSIQPGQTVTLSWAAENPTSVNIDPFGRVAPRGRRTLSPTVTTTYTLAVTGAGNSAEKRTVTVTVAGTMPGVSPADASAANDGGRNPSREPPDGKPDLSGVYGYGGGGGGRGGPPPAVAGGLPTTPTLKPGAESSRW